MSRYDAIPVIVALSPGHSDIIRFHPWSPIATGNNLDRAEKKLLRLLTPLRFLIRVQAFRDPLRGELPHVQIFMNDGRNSLTMVHVPLMFLSEWREFPSAPCLARKKKT